MNSGALPSANWTVASEPLDAQQHRPPQLSNSLPSSMRPVRSRMRAGRLCQPAPSLGRSTLLREVGSAVSAVAKPRTPRFAASAMSMPRGAPCGSPLWR